MLWECDDDGYNKWFINLDFMDWARVPDTPFEIRAGNKLVMPRQKNFLSDWCLDGGDIDANSSLLSIWECNGLPQQQFNADGIDPKHSFEGSFYFPNGKCLDGTESMEQGTTPLVWECNGQDQQMWSIQMCSIHCEYREPCGDTVCSDDTLSSVV